MYVLNKLFNRMSNKPKKMYPKVSMNSLSSKVNLIVSSTNGLLGNGLFVLLLLSTQFRFLVKLSETSLDSTFSVSPETIIYCLIEIYLICLFHFKFDKKFIHQVHQIWQLLMIDFDHSTRCYFAIQRSSYRKMIIITYFFMWIPDLVLDAAPWPYTWVSSFECMIEMLLSEPSLHFWSRVFVLVILYPACLMQDFIIIDSAFSSQSALHYINNQLAIIDKHLKMNDVKLDIQVIQDLRVKYVLTHRLVKKLGSFLNPCLFGIFSYYVSILNVKIYNILFIEHEQSDLILLLIDCFGTIAELFLLIIPIAAITTKSREFYTTLYKLTFRTDSFKDLNEISLFLYRMSLNNIGFTFGGIFMITRDFISSLIAVTVTIIIAIPFFIS
uniref:Gustatory receptor n=1 Tax=Tetranychus urticae TaxID=32264 RepID=T1L360_TETUR